MFLSNSRIRCCAFFLCFATCIALWGCGNANTAGNGIVVGNNGGDAVGLADADTGDTAADTDTTADAAADAPLGDETAPDAIAEIGADVAVDADPDAATDAVVEEVTDPIDVAGPDTPPDDADADAAADAADASPTDTTIVPACTTDADCGTTTPYCGSAGACVACTFPAQCPGDGAFCLNNSCVPPVGCTSDVDCKSLGAVCDTGKGVCRACLSAKDCPSNQSCTANQCVAVTTCVSSKECPGALVCAAGVCVVCGADTDCLAAQFCNQNVCTQDVCAPGSHCEGNAIATCKTNGGGWNFNDCGATAICLNATCEPLVCTPLATSCQADKLATCNATGTQLTVAACPANQTCVGTVCVDFLCVANTKKCDGTGGLLTCSADGMSWTPSSCDDKDACTTDSCDALTATCTHGVVNCDDGNTCTTDSCNKGCQHAGLTGPTCDDGNACSSGETCSGGKCTAPVASANVSTIAGSGAAGNTNGAGSSASFARPYGLARLADGSMVSTDYDSHRIRQIQTDGTVSTLAGNGSSGAVDGAATSATFTNPTSVAAASTGTLFIADYGNSRIRALSGGVVSTFVGSTAGFKDGVGTAAQFNSVQDIKFDANGVLWAADRANHRIRRITGDGTVTTAAGTGVAGYLDGAAAQAQFNEPCRIAPASDGSVYIADCSNYRIRRLSADGQLVSTISGSGIGYIDGAGSSAKFAWMGGLTWLGATLIVSDNGNNRIRAVAGDGSVTTLAGSGSASYIDGAPSSAAFSAQWNVASDWTGALWIADGANQRIRKLSFTNLVCNDGNPCTIDSCGANACVFTPVAQGSPCSDGTACTLSDACSANGKCVGMATICADSNPCTTDFCNPVTGACVFAPSDGPCVDNNICTNGEHCVGGACLADVNTVVTVAGAAASGYVDGAGKDARFNAAFGLALSKNGGTYVSDAGGNRIRAVAADGTTSTLAGTGVAGFLDGAASTAQFNNPTRLALDGQGALLIADSLNNRIRKLSGTTVSTIAGSGTTGFLDGAPASAQFSSPFGLVYSAGVIYVADSGNHRIRAIAPNGTVSTLAGSGTDGYADGTLATASFSSPRGLCQASNGTLYVVDTYGNNIRRIASGQVTTLAGGGPAADDGIGLAAGFDQPRDCTVDPSGNIYVTDTYNNRLRRITPEGVVTTIAGTTIGGGSFLTGTDGSALASVLAYPAVPAWGPGGTIWFADNNAIRKFIPANVDCGDGLPCTTDVCNGTTGACSSSPSPNGATCDDGKLCVVSETCTSGVCGGGTAKSCDDGDKCTIDSCGATTGCQHVKSTSLPGCCNPNVFQTGFESDGGNGITLTSAVGTTLAWSIGVQSKAHTGSGAMAVTTLTSNGTATATLPSVTLPAGAATLSFWLYYDAVPSQCDTIFGDPCGTATFKVLVNGVQATAQTTATNTWTQVTVSSSLVGGTTPSVQLVFATAAATTSLFSYNYASAGTGVFVDDIQVTSTCQ